MPPVLVRAVAAVPLVMLTAILPAASPAGLVASGRPAAATSETIPAKRGTLPASELRPARAYAPPVPGAVVHPFDPPVEEWAAGHRGVDLAANVGDAIGSPGPGLVTFAGQVGGKRVVVVTHPDGLRSTLEPVVAGVGTGATVAAGEVLGTLTEAPVTADNPGHCVPDDCLHWGVRRGNTYLDPLALLGDAPPIVLLPVSR